MEAQPLPYIRVGTNYYKTVSVPLISGDSMVCLKPWLLDFIKQDHGRDVIARIPKYDDFFVIPDHLDYLSVISFCLNDLQDWLLKKGNRGVETFLIKKILREEWNIKPCSNSLSYTRYSFLQDGSIGEDVSKGRYYKVNQEFIALLEAN